MRHVILGAGAAGLSAVRKIRSLSAEDEIVVISIDTHVHSRCMLHKYISGQRDVEHLSFVEENFWEKYNASWISGKEVLGIQTDSQTVLLGQDESVSYDRLLIATGANSVTPPIGALKTAPNVYGLRHLSDAIEIKKASQDAKRIVIIGAGLVGLDAAWGLLELNKEVSVVEMGERILPLNLNAKGAKLYQQKFEESGCIFHLGRKVMDTICDDNGHVTGLRLDTDDVLPCDFVIVAAGVSPATGFLKESGVAYTRAVTVDMHLRTNIENIYAAGDVAGLSGIWPNAVDQGAVAAVNMCGGSAVYEDRFAIKNTLNFFGIPSLSVGATKPEPEDTCIEREDQNRYQQYILRDGKVKGVILQGDISNSGFWQELIKREIIVSHIEKPVWELSYADFYQIDETGAFSFPATCAQAM